MTKRDELEMLAVQISKFLSENYDTGYKVIIDCDTIELVSEVISIEVPQST